MYSLPLVSILVNNYNYSKYLSLAIDSALNQTYPHTEIIVVDDGSTDNSQQIIDSYGDRIIPLIKENGGQASAVNAGFAVSKGDIICLLDADDLWLPSKVEQVVKAFNNHPQAAVVYHQIQDIDGEGFPSDKPPAYGKPRPPYRAIAGNIRTQVINTGGWWPYAPSTSLSFSRQFMTKVMDIPESESQTGDRSF